MSVRDARDALVCRNTHFAVSQRRGASSGRHSGVTEERGRTRFLTRGHLSAIGALTADGRVLMHTQPEPLRGPRVVRFLRHLLRHIAGKLLVIWDGSPIHRSQVVKDLLSEGGAKRLWLEHLPGYARDLNPVEGIWHYLKQIRLNNVCCRTLAEVRYEVRLATANLRHKATVLANLPKHYGCPL